KRDQAEAIVSETLASILTTQGKFEEAIKVYIQLARIAPERLEYFNTRIETLKRLMEELDEDDSPELMRLIEGRDTFVATAEAFPVERRRAKPSQKAFSATEIVYHMLDVEE